jgi:hypothetical protein
VDDLDPPPARAPEINQVLDTALLALSLAKSDVKRLQAITTAAKMLHRFGRTADAIEVQDIITESAMYTYNLAPVVSLTSGAALASPPRKETGH